MGRRSRLQAAQPCPFCGAREVYPVPLVRASWFVRCTGCKAAGPEASTRTGAVTVWNSRKEQEQC